MLPLVKKYWLLCGTFALLFLAVFLVNLDYKNSHKGLTFAMLDVGQGDGLFIESPTGTQIMFDAGSAHKVLGPLSRVMPFYDKEIDAIVITNPDADHIGGFLDILKSYKVGLVLEPGTINDSKTFQNLKSEIKKQKIPDILAKKGMRLHLGGGAVIEILFPDRDVSLWDANDGSIIARLSYGDTSVMLTGDATKKTEEIILKNNSKSKLASTILKVGHHGSRTSTSDEFVKAVAPEYALISDGKSNNYGHPHRETLDILGKIGAKILRTDLSGTVIVKSDGSMLRWQYAR